MEIFSSCLTAFFLFGVSCISWRKTQCLGKQPKLLIYARKDNRNYMRGTANGEKNIRSLDIKFSSVKFFFHARETVNNFEAAAFLCILLQKYQPFPSLFISFTRKDLWQDQTHTAACESYVNTILLQGEIKSLRTTDCIVEYNFACLKSVGFLFSNLIHH